MFVWKMMTFAVPELAQHMVGVHDNKLNKLILHREMINIKQIFKTTLVDYGLLRVTDQCGSKFVQSLCYESPTEST